jgi:peptidyl-prolyl cis-trans isomerase SurA
VKKRLTPNYITAAMPRVYAEKDLQAELCKCLTRQECREIINPLAATPPMTNWASELTQGAGDDLTKAKKLFDALARHLQRDPGGTRTAQEVFAVWNDPKESFSCQEYAKLFVALARAVGIKAFYVHLEKDYAGRVVYHDCAAVFASGKALLVDPAYQWFGAPHQEFLLLNDLQAIAHHFFQPAKIESEAQVSRCRMAAKLHPDFAWGQIALTRSLIEANRLDEARKALKSAFQLEPDRWDAYQLQGVLALRDGKPEQVLISLKKASDLNPGNGLLHFHLAHAYQEQGKSKEARKEFDAALQSGLEPEFEKDATHHLAEMNEKPGSRLAHTRTNLPPGVVAMVNDRPIRESEVSEKMRSAEETLKRQYKNEPAVFQEKQDEAKRDTLENLIDRALILDEAGQLGLGIKPNDLQKAIEEIVRDRYYGDTNTFLATLRTEGKTEDGFREWLEQEMIVSSRRDFKRREVAAPTPGQIQRYYKTNQSEFLVKDQVKLRMIVLNKPPATNAPPAAQQAEEILAKLKDGASFAELAKSYSQGSHREQGGDWGWVEKSVLRPELAAEAFSLKPGEHSGVIATPEACFLLLVEDKRAAHTQPLSEVREQIRKKLAAQQLKDAVANWLGTLRTNAVILRAP